MIRCAECKSDLVTQSTCPDGLADCFACGAVFEPVPATYTAVLWACRGRHTPSGCQRYRYLEPGDEPGPCDGVYLVGICDNVRAVQCKRPMDRVGEFQLEAA